MKLLRRYNRANILTALIILLASSVAYYFIIRIILIQQLDKDLQVEEQEIHEYISDNNSLPNASEYKDQEIKFEPAGSNPVRRRFKSKWRYNTEKKEHEPVRTITFPVSVNGVVYKAIVIKSQVEAEDLLTLIVIVTAVILLLLLATIWLINRFLLNKLWQPFYHTLQQLKSFNLKSSHALQLAPSNIEEFKELNTSVVEMTERVSHEFITLKAFTDNASHEMQTPLAIINAKLDLLLQNSTEKQAEQLQAIYDATGRLTRLNQTLLLLTRIDNEQFKTHEQANLKKLIIKKFQQFEELIKGRNIKLTHQLEEACISINKELADILLNNLISNAIKHNYVDGYINCTLTSDKLMISNSGQSLTFSSEHIFNRFQKNDHSDGTGLGLAVVKQICESSGLTITYTNNNDEHTFTIFFKNQQC